ncbi:MAG TPA: N-methyl-L-tryptophan oxidase [Candidatus Limnocylindrales bacterium]|nr:N-methyl-L-tryptophan oxidase [Candidatus Limnocylindrales bacterium]
MAHKADVIVLGAGAIGSAAAYHAARRGFSVTLLEQYAIDHERGSSYGVSRIIRYAYDHPAYVRLARAAFLAWDALADEAGEALLTRTGGVDIGNRSDPALVATAAALESEGIPFELLDAQESRRRFPQFRLDDDMAMLYQADAAILPASRCVGAHVRLAERHGAHIHTEEPVARIEAHDSGVRVTTSKAVYESAVVIVAAGSWANDLLAPLDFALPLRPVACQENYFAPAVPETFAIGPMPVFIAHMSEDYGYMPYGLPSVDGSGFKLALHGGPDFDPHRPDRPVDTTVIDAARRFAGRHLPGAADQHLSSRMCLYTMTPDEHFIIDRHPAHPSVIVGAACSGHAFKFSTLLGSILVDLAVDGQTAHDISLFRAGRFDNEVSL